MQAREFVARRFQLHRGGVGSEITDSGPIKYFNRSSRSSTTGGGQTSPQSLKTHVSTGHAPLASGFNDLHVIDAHHAFAVDVDQLFIEHIAREQHFAFSSDKGAKIDNV